jgi:3-oxoacyl-[acyl-carrier protein] reductase
MENTMNLNNKVALVLGAIKGIGKAIGIFLAEQGAQVALNYYDWEESLDAMTTDFKNTTKQYAVFQTDLRDTRRVASLIDKVVARFGGIDILINNIERGGWPVVHGPYVSEQWDLEMATTLKAKRWVFEAALPHLKKSENGVVINLSSIAGIVGRSGPAQWIFNDGYAAANRGISLLTETWARMGAPRVRVNEIMLGFFETRHADQTRGWGLLTNEQKRAIVRHTLLGRTGALDDIVKTVKFLIADAPYMTGAVLRLDGGYILGGESVGPMPQGIL